ncbi:MAG: SusC/RagA family TonB-linked outer membrane protein [Saprospiraceae bacterium]|nr:SusC/RagA family TonB-linked outer membrane protein [Saprospiraceae bacterium]
MKLTAVLLVAACLNVGAFSSAQEITLSEKGASLQKIFRQIHHQTGYQFFYEDELLDKAGKIDIHVEKASLDETLTRCFERLDLSYVIVNKTIVVNVRKRDVEASRSLPPAPIRKPVLPIDVSGKVVMENGEPAIGVTVAVKGTFIGTFTDENGRYALENINDNDTLVFSAVNILTIEAPVAGRTVVDVVVRSSISVLDEVQVIGYGITTRRLQTGSVGTVKSQILERQPVANPLQALQGRIAGVSITQTAGAIGSGVEIQVRGVNTIESGNQPLIIVDGAVMPDPNRGLGTSVGSYMPWGSSSMTNLNSADIESIEILKDADATSIYGSRGANGVVLITTKKAKLGATKFNVDVSTWVNSATDLPERLTLAQYLQMRRDAFAMGNYNPTTKVAINPIAATANNAPDLLVWDTTQATTDWTDFEYGNQTPAISIQSSLSGGDKRLNFYASGGYLKQTDITRGSPYQERLSTSLGLNHTSANDRLSANLSASYLQNTISPSRGGGSPGLLSSLPPNMPMTNADGSPFWPSGSITQNSLLLNPFAAEESRTQSGSKNFIGNLDVSYRLFKGLILKTQLGFNEQTLNNKSITPSTSINPLNPGTTVPGSSFSESRFQSVNLEPQITYSAKIAKGKLELLVGSTFFNRKLAAYRISFNGFATDALLDSWAGGSSVESRSNSSTDYRFNSVFGRANYNWGEKYLLNLTFRRDGSSRFGPERQWGDFGAVGLGWVFSNEKVFKDKIPGFSYGKLRGSYGTSGNDNISDYRWTSLYSTAVYDGRSGLAASFLSDPFVGWETSRKLDLAAELGFFKDRILLNVNWYRTHTTDLLLSTPVPAQTGFTTFITNTPAVVENKGWEFELTTQNTDPKSAWQWRTNFNLSLLKNQLLEFPDLENSSFANRLRIGLPINSPRYPLNAEWSQVYRGVDPATGLPIFDDLDGSGTINNNDRTYIGSAIPRTFGGFSNTISFKGLELDLFFQFSQQLATNWMFNSIYPGQLNNPVAADFYGNYWKQPGDNAQYPRLWSGAASNTTTNLLSSIFPLSSAALEDILYVRLKNASLAYTLPSQWVSKAKMTRAVLYVRGQNLLTWTSKELHKDPELIQLRGGMILKTWTAGIQLTL